jgi:hypothetical protein
LPKYRVRPRFKFVFEGAPESFIDLVDTKLKQQDASCKGVINASHIALLIPAEDQHYWSPQLSVTFDKNENDAGCIVRGMYGPNPAVWTMFVFFYGLIAFAILAIAVIGFSQLSLGNSASVLWIIPGLIIVFLSLYLVAYFGQKTGEAQMIRLHQFLEESIGFPIDETRCIH